MASSEITSADQTLSEITSGDRASPETNSGGRASSETTSGGRASSEIASVGRDSSEINSGGRASPETTSGGRASSEITDGDQSRLAINRRILNGMTYIRNLSEFTELTVLYTNLGCVGGFTFVLAADITYEDRTVIMNGAYADNCLNQETVFLPLRRLRYCVHSMSDVWNISPVDHITTVLLIPDDIGYTTYHHICCLGASRGFLIGSGALKSELDAGYAPVVERGRGCYLDDMAAGLAGIGFAEATLFFMEKARVFVRLMLGSLFGGVELVHGGNRAIAGREDVNGGNQAVEGEED